MQINRQTYEEFFLLYIDNELSADERKEVDDFVKDHPDLKQELEVLQESVMVPDESIIFAGKELLYKKEEEKKKIIATSWWKLAAAAVVLFSLGTAGWLYINQRTNPVSISKIDKPANSHENISLHKTSPDIKSTEKIMQETVLSEKKSRPAVIVTKHSSHKKIERLNVPAKETGEEKNDIAGTREIQIKPHALNEPPTEINRKINIEVEGRELANTQDVAIIRPQVTEVVMEEEPRNNMFHFATTSVIKKNKLRGVFRKASRILEKVTTMGASNDDDRPYDNEIASQ